jgi:hypothetical protein
MYMAHHAIQPRRILCNVFSVASPYKPSFHSTSKATYEVWHTKAEHKLRTNSDSATKSIDFKFIVDVGTANAVNQTLDQSNLQILPFDFISPRSAHHVPSNYPQPLISVPNPVKKPQNIRPGTHLHRHLTFDQTGIA